MSTETRDLLLLVIALVVVAGSVYFYVAAVLDSDRLLSRSAALTFVVFCAIAAALLWRVL